MLVERYHLYCLILLLNYFDLLNSKQFKKIRFDERNEYQTLGFISERNPKEWESFRWEKLTIVCPVNFHSRKLNEIARFKEIPTILYANFTLADTLSFERTNRWISERLNEIQYYRYDGIDLNIDDEVEKNSIESNSITEFVRIVSLNFEMNL
ncbi:hypothetical protein SSS_02633 [Sarcoptes scabiei]|nr:hypothetical protein SSS_02633 [Sarcoptes scabiei]